MGMPPSVNPGVAAPRSHPTRASVPSIAVVACIEAGELESKTVRMVDSLRRFGGRFADLDVLVTTPRLGPGLARETQQRLADLNVRHTKLRPTTNYVWHHYMNKPQAIVAAERELDAEQILWVDSDIIFLREPNCLELTDEIDFVASAPDTGAIGTTGDGDLHEPFWARCSDLLGLSVEELPWLTTGDGHRIRFLWNSGVFVYRRSTELGAAYAADLEKALRMRVARRHDEVHFIDQVILGLTVLRLGLSWRPIPDTSNFPVLGDLPGNFDPAKVRDVDVLHYHDSMAPSLWPRLLGTLLDSHGDVHDWLETLGPIRDPASRRGRLLREGLRVKRGLSRRMYYARGGFTKGSQAALGR
jgi:hypothetical protein